MKNNKLISAFMGCDLSMDWLQYHRDWSELMGVIEKIESTPVNGYTWTCIENKAPVEFWFTFEIKGTQCMVCRDVLPQYYGTDEDFLKLYDCRNISKIDATYLAVVKFIQWYNRQMKLKCNQPEFKDSHL